MAICNRLSQFFEKNKTHYEVVPHPRAVSAQRTAEAEHAPGRAFAKVVMLKSDNKYIMAVMPACFQLDLMKLRKLLRAKDVHLATEEEFNAIFDDCEVGAMPPFGNIYHMPTVMDESLSENENIVFNAGTHTDSVKISYRDYKDLVHPDIYIQSA